MTKTIIFDFGGVLVDWDPHHLYDEYFGSREKTDWFLANICTMAWNVQMDGGKPFAEGIAELSAEYPEWSKEIRMFFDRWIEMMGDELPGMRELLQDLKAHGYRLLGLTNWSCETFCQVRHRYPVFDLLDGMLVSGEERLTKPSPAIFRRMIEKFSLEPSECVFIDDNQANVEGSVAAGLPAILFPGASKLREMFLPGV
ncbi:MAG: HAD family phosphatase [Bacteroidales bacterium]|nr:HAD family phosphatase [Bacteroidales bacterium]